MIKTIYYMFIVVNVVHLMIHTTFIQISVDFIIDLEISGVDYTIHFPIN